LIKQTNTRVVKWSDGSKTLYIGKEAFGMKEPKLPDYHHLFIRHRWSEKDSYYEMHGVINKKVTLNASRDAYRKQLQKLQLKHALMSSKKRSSIFTVGSTDPKLEKQAKEKFEESKANIRAEFSTGKGTKKKDSLNPEYLELGADEDYEGRDYDEEGEKEAEKRIMNVKRGKKFR